MSDKKVTEPRVVNVGNINRRPKIKVNGTLYTSVLAAFKALGWPTKGHKAFREKLINKGRANINKTTFRLVRS